MRHRLLNNGDLKTYALILDTGDDVMKSITDFANEQELSASQFTAIGAFSEATLAFFNFETKDYNHLPVYEQTEVLTFNGNITLTEENKIQIHAHAVLGKADGSTTGGHVLAATVHPTLEIILTETPVYLNRHHDSETGLQLLKF
jgi:predicted DNA-binding protein with PD1-like motif